MDLARIKHLVDKTKAFYDTRTEGCALLKVKSIATHRQTSLTRPLNTYQFPEDVQPYIDQRAASLLESLRRREGLWDDTIPALAPWYGAAEHSAFLGSKVIFGEDTSWQSEILTNITDLTALSKDPSNSSLRMVVDGIRYIREKYEGQFYAMTRGVSGALEMVNTLRGNDFFYDFYDEPEALKKALDYCAEALVWYYDQQLEAAGEVYGGTMTGFGEWMPGRAIGHMSEDTTVMISPSQYEEFGRPCTQRICEQYDAAFMHTHAAGEHCLSSIASIPGIRLMEISSDPNTERAIEVYKRNRDRLKGPIPVMLLKREEILHNMELLKSQKTIIWYDATCMEDAQDMVKRIHEELPVK